MFKINQSIYHLSAQKQTAAADSTSEPVSRTAKLVTKNTKKQNNKKAFPQTCATLETR